MVEQDCSIVCQQNSKEHETKKQNDNHQTSNLTGSIETDKNNRKQHFVLIKQQVFRPALQLY